MEDYGQPTRSLERVKTSLRVLRQSYAYTLVGDFGPRALQALQRKLASSNLSRRYVNYLIDTIRRVFRWGVSQEIVPETVYRALATVSGLRAGRTEAHEMERIGPVDGVVVDATLPYLSPIVADMVRFEQATGCRPAEVCSIGPCNVDTSGDIWVYTPRRHKTHYRGHKRIIFIGPHGQDVPRPYLLREKKSYCFSHANCRKNMRSSCRSLYSGTAAISIRSGFSAAFLIQTIRSVPASACR